MKSQDTTENEINKAVKYKNNLNSNFKDTERPQKRGEFEDELVKSRQKVNTS